MGRDKGKPASNGKRKPADSISSNTGGVGFAVKCGGLVAVVAAGAVGAFFFLASAAGFR